MNNANITICNITNITIISDSKVKSPFNFVLINRSFDASNIYVVTIYLTFMGNFKECKSIENLTDKGYKMTKATNDIKYL